MSQPFRVKKTINDLIEIKRQVEIAREDLAPSDFIEDMEAMKENLLEDLDKIEKLANKIIKGP